jgi:hypothetical protein
MRLRRLLGPQESLGRDAVGIWDCWPIRDQSAYIYCQNPCDAATRPAHFELQFKLLGAALGDDEDATATDGILYALI